MTESNAVPPALRELLAIFAEHLPQVRFGDLDEAVLQAACEDVQAAVQAAQEAEAALEAARTRLDEVRQSLLLKGQRALAYARIYAETSPTLLARLETVALGAAPRKEEPSEGPGRRRRTPKVAPDRMPALPLTTNERDQESGSPFGHRQLS